MSARPRIILRICATLIALSAGVRGHALAFLHTRYENLGNSTEYVFPAPPEKVLAVLRKVRGPKSWGPLAGSYFADRGFYGFGVFDYYTTRYWSGRREKREEVVPAEAGRIGTIQADFAARIVPQGAGHTLVSVTVTMFEQQTGRRYSVFPHFRKGPIFGEVKSDTYFEYLFLLKLGELLGEAGMPPLKGDGKDDAGPGD